MTETACFLTVKRAHLIDMTERLFGAIEKGFLQDAEKPLTVAMTGSKSSGKTVVVGTVQDMLFYARFFDFSFTNQLPCFQQQRGKTAQGDPLDVRLYDGVAWSHLLYKVFCSKREAGGINFVQNAPHLNEAADMAICIEDIKFSTPLNYLYFQGKNFLSALEQINLMTDPEANAWGRFVSVRVNNQALLESRRFRDAFNAFDPLPGADMVAIEKNGRIRDMLSLAFRDVVGKSLKPADNPRLLPVYGQSFPHFPGGSL